MAFSGAEKSARWRERDKAHKSCLVVPMKTTTQAQLSDDLVDFGWLDEKNCKSKLAIGEALGAAHDAGAPSIKLYRRKKS
jgi:hypothetical protein